MFRVNPVRFWDERFKILEIQSPSVFCQICFTNIIYREFKTDFTRFQMLIQQTIFSGEMPGKTKPQICGIGQPLLDITATVGDGFLNRYGLNSNDSILANEDHTNIFQVCTP